MKLDTLKKEHQQGFCTFYSPLTLARSPYRWKLELSLRRVEMLTPEQACQT